MYSVWQKHTWKSISQLHFCFVVAFLTCDGSFELRTGRNPTTNPSPNVNVKAITFLNLAKYLSEEATFLQLKGYCIYIFKYISLSLLHLIVFVGNDHHLNVSKNISSNDDSYKAKVDPDIVMVHPASSSLFHFQFIRSIFIIIPYVGF